jgi:hypothetical protein
LHGGRLGEANKTFELTSEYSKLYQPFEHELDKINKYDAQDIRDLFEGLKNQTVNLVFPLR